MPARPTDTSQAAPSLEGSVERVLFCISAILQYADASASQQAELRKAALILRGLDAEDLETLLGGLQETASESDPRMDAETSQPTQVSSSRRAMQQIVALAAHAGPKMRPGDSTPAAFRSGPPAVMGSSIFSPGFSEPARPMTTIVPSTLTTARWDSGRRNRLAGQSRIDPAPPRSLLSTQRVAAVSRIDAGRRPPATKQEDLVRSIPATGWVPREAGTPAPSARPDRPEPLPSARRWELLRHFDSGSRPAAEPATARSAETPTKP